MLEEECDYYTANKPSFIPKYEGKYLVSMGQVLVGVYDKIEDAYHAAMTLYHGEPFLIQKCEQADEVQVFNRVIF
jgi:hypothetical protein